jgi:hypothetical protein
MDDPHAPVTADPSERLARTIVVLIASGAVAFVALVAIFVL